MDLSAALAGDGERIGVPYSGLLTQFAEAVLGTDDILLDRLRDELMTEMGGATLSDTAATVASYNSIVKIADATGIPLDIETAEKTADMRAELGIVP